MKQPSRSLVAGLCAAVAITRCLEAAEPPTASAPQLPRAVKLENRTWYKLWYVQFKPTRSDHARQLVERVAKAGAEAYSTPPIVLNLETGKWHLLLIMKVRDGARGLDWLQDPEDEKFWQALAKHEGGPDKALALWGELVECIQDGQYELATKLDVAKP